LKHSNQKENSIYLTQTLNKEKKGLITLTFYVNKL